MNRLQSLNIVKDSRVNCYSAMTTMSIKNYLKLVNDAYSKRGGIKGQREPIKTNTATRIRERMVKDLQSGAVLPAVVVGIVVAPERVNELGTIDIQDFDKLLDMIPPTDVSIIDGIQRTTALLELKESLDKLMRVEFWVASNTNSLIYRMLVLNTGQVPWNLRRQVEVVFDSLINEIAEKIPELKVIKIDDGKRRTSAGKFQSNQIIELFLIFGTRKDKVNVEERLADEFTRLDFIQATSNDKFTNIFCEALQLLVDFDISFDKYQFESTESLRFQIGRDLFSSLPAQVGFIAALAAEVLGRPGTKERSPEEQRERLDIIKEKANNLLSKLKSMPVEKIGSFLDFDTLNELVSTNKKPGKVGEFEREFFVKAFSTLIEQRFEVENLTSCWRAY